MCQHSERPLNIQTSRFLPTSRHPASITANLNETIRGISKNYLLSQSQYYQPPKMCGIPKIHKKFRKLPPMRPIVAQSGSPLSPSARFIDHVLQRLHQKFDRSNTSSRRYRSSRNISAGNNRCGKSIPIYTTIRMSTNSL